MTDDIEAIIFDLGQVIIDVDSTRSFRAFEALGVKNIEHIIHEERHKEVFHKFEKGEIDTQAFRTFMREVTGVSLTDGQIDKAWEAMLGDIPGIRLELINELNEIFSTFLLSNTNPIHLNAIYNYVEQVQLIPFSRLFRSEYYSHQLGMRKPDPSIFRHILDENELNATNTLFLDDSIEHIKSARRLGLKTIQVNKQNDLVSILNRLKSEYKNA